MIRHIYYLRFTIYYVGAMACPRPHVGAGRVHARKSEFFTFHFLSCAAYSIKSYYICGNMEFTIYDL